MPKAILEFNLPEERDEHKNALEGGSYKAAVQSFDNYLRGKLKYEDHPEDIQAIYEELRDKLYEEFNNYGILIWE